MILEVEKQEWSWKLEMVQKVKCSLFSHSCHDSLHPSSSVSLYLRRSISSSPRALGCPNQSPIKLDLFTLYLRPHQFED
ncbi:hypothetical protein P8452_09549 [Trifolium repens]|nr:hypothetical protein P8452_09549 [Trifolium repens]